MNPYAIDKNAIMHTEQVLYAALWERGGEEAAREAKFLEQRKIDEYYQKLNVDELPIMPVAADSGFEIKDIITYKPAAQHLKEFDGVPQLDLFVYKVAVLADKKGSEGQSILKIALHRSDISMLKLGICLAPGLLKETFEGKTLLHEAVEKGVSLDTIKWLTSSASLLNSATHGIDINDRDRIGNTAMHYALWHGHQELAFFLHSKGAKLDLKNNLQQTPAEYALQRVDLLQNQSEYSLLLQKLILLAIKFAPPGGFDTNASSKSVKIKVEHT